MTKCDFCPCSVLNKDGNLICVNRALWRCQEAIEKMMKYAELESKANNANTDRKSGVKHAT